MAICRKCLSFCYIYKRTYSFTNTHRNLDLLLKGTHHALRTSSVWPSLQRNFSILSDKALHSSEAELETSPSRQPVRENGNENETERNVAVTKEEQFRLSHHKPDQPGDARLLKVAIIGAPNAGKSTLVNQLLGWKVAPVSQKVHTTRERTVGVLSEGNSQVVLLDTPGIIHPAKRKKHHLERSLLTDPHATLYEADLIAVIVDVSCVWNHSKLDQEVLKVLHLHSQRPSILLLNKVDCVKKKYHLLQVTRMLTEGIVDGQRDSIKISELAEAKTSRPSLEDLFEKTQKEKGHRVRHSDSLELTSDNRQIDNIDISERGTDHSLPDNIRQTGDYGHENLESTSSPGLKSSTNDMIEPGDQLNDNSSTEEVTSSISCWDGQSAPDLSDSQVWHAYHSRLRELNQIVKKKKGWPLFSKVFMISALEGDGIIDVREYLLSRAVPSSWMYHSAVVTDQDPQQVARMTVWAKLLDYLPSEIPYNVTVKKTLWEVDQNDTLHAAFDLVCSRKRDMFSCIGKGGSTLKRISSESKQELMNIFRREMTLRLAVKLKK